jgi:hypothetical protein
MGEIPPSRRIVWWLILVTPGVLFVASVAVILYYPTEPFMFGSGVRLHDQIGQAPPVPPLVTFAMLLVAGLWAVAIQQVSGPDGGGHDG